MSELIYFISCKTAQLLTEDRIKPNLKACGFLFDFMNETIKTLSTIPMYTWIALLILLVCIGMFLLNIFKTKDLVIGRLSITEKEQFRADASALEDNQIRHGRVHILSISQLITTSAKECFPDITTLEYAYIKLLADSISQSLLNQFRMDLLRNHFTKLTDDQLKIYTDEKANNYFLYVKTYLHDFNESLPRLDFMKIMQIISIDKFHEIYKKAYESARNLTVGY